MAVEEIIFKISADTGQANKETGKLEAELEAVNEAAKELTKSTHALDASFEDVYGDIKPLSSRIGEMEDRMYELALANKTNTDEYRELQTETARYRQVIISTDKAVDQLAEQGTGLGAALQIGTAVTAGYGALQGSMVALGIESESLEKSFVKLQAVQTILASLEQLKLSLDKQSIVVTKAKAIATGVVTTVQTAWTAATAGTTVAMGALKVAMLAIPLVAILAGIVALVVALKDLASATEMVERVNDKLDKSFEKVTEAFERFDAKTKQSISNRIKLAKAQGKSIEEVHELEMEQLEINEKSRKKDIEITSSLLKQKRALLKTAREYELDDQADAILEDIKASKEHYKELKLLDGQYYADKQVLEIEHQKALAEEEKKAQDKRNADWKRASEKRQREEEAEARRQIERQRLLEDLIIENIEDEEVRKLSALQLSHERQREEIIKKHGEDTMLLSNLATKQNNEIDALNAEFDNKRLSEQKERDKQAQEQRKKESEQALRDRRAQLEGELIAEREDFEATMAVKRELAEFEMNQELLQTDLTEGEKFKIKEEYALKLEQLDEQEAQRKIDLEKQTAEAVKSVYDSSFTAISNLADGIFAIRIANAEEGSKKELELEKKKFEINKKLQIAQAIMQGIQAVQAAFASGSAIPVVGAITGPAFAAAAGIAALGNIAKIKATTFQGGGSVSSTSVTPPTIGNPQLDEEPQGDTTTLTEGLEGSGQQTVKVGIVDSEIKLALQNDDKVNVISTVG